MKSVGYNVEIEKVVRKSEDLFQANRKVAKLWYLHVESFIGELSTASGPANEGRRMMSTFLSRILEITRSAWFDKEVICLASHSRMH